MAIFLFLASSIILISPMGLISIALKVRNKRKYQPLKLNAEQKFWYIQGLKVKK